MWTVHCPSLAHSDVSYTTGSYPCLYCLINNKIWQHLSQHVAMLHPDPYVQSILTIKNIFHQAESVKQPNRFIIASVNPSLTFLLNRYSGMICMLMYLHCTKIDLPTWPAYHISRNTYTTAGLKLGSMHVPNLGYAFLCWSYI